MRTACDEVDRDRPNACTHPRRRALLAGPALTGPGTGSAPHWTPGVAAILSLQRTAGNSAVTAMLAAAATPVVQRTIGDGHDLGSSRFAGDERLEACFDDEARLTLGATGPSVAKVQQALIERGHDLGPSGADGIYGNRTWNAVKRFKAEEQLGFEHMGDVGPGTMTRLDQLFADVAPEPGADVDLTDGFAAADPLVCGGAEDEEAEELPDGVDTADTIGGDGLLGGLGELADDLEAGLAGSVQRQDAGKPAPAQPFTCPTFSDFSTFTGKPPAGKKGKAAFTSTEVSLSGGSVVAKFRADRSWKDPDVVPSGGQRVPKDATVVKACVDHFGNPRAQPFSRTSPIADCLASAANMPTRTAANSTECTTTFGAALDQDRAKDTPRLLRHEQYHMNLACALARIANRLIAGGTTPRRAAARAIAANKKLQAQYDTETDGGCLPNAQARWESDIDADKLTL